MVLPLFNQEEKGKGSRSKRIGFPTHFFERARLNLWNAFFFQPPPNLYVGPAACVSSVGMYNALQLPPRHAKKYLHSHPCSLLRIVFN